MGTNGLAYVKASHKQVRSDVKPGMQFRVSTPMEEYTRLALTAKAMCISQCKKVSKTSDNTDYTVML